MIRFLVPVLILAWFALFTAYAWVDLGDLIRQQAEDETSA